MGKISVVAAGSETDPCCCEPPVFCHDLIGDSLDVLNTDMAACSACYTMPDGGPDFKLSWTGVNGGYTLAWDGSQWALVVGTLTVTTYSSTDGSCADEDTVFTYDILQRVLCAGDNSFNCFINSAAAVGGTPVTFSFFQEVSAETFDIPMVNGLLVADCGGISGGPPASGQAAYGGFVTVPTQP